MAIMEEEVVRVTAEGAVTEIVINRPKALNALNMDVLSSLGMKLDKIVESSTPRAIILTGEGSRAFVAGADVPSMAQLGPRAIADYVELGQRIMRQIENCRVPIIAAVNGFALGGGLELALACDMIIAVTTAKVGQPEVNLGIIPGFGGTQRLIERCGIGTARRLVLTGEIIEAAEAFQLGVVDKVVEPADLMAAARKWGELIATKAPLAVSAAKRVIRRGQEQAFLAGLQTEVESFLELFGSADREEGMSAFMQKREPSFKGK